MPPNAPVVAVTVNIAFRPRSGDLILVNAGLAKPIRHVLVYSGFRERAFALFATHNEWPGRDAAGCLPMFGWKDELADKPWQCPDAGP
jgi:hypothetical protein